jgi:predicted CopG family antitoxin
MGDGEKAKAKMIQVSKSVYKKLLEKRHKLETSSESNWSFSSVIEYLLEHQKDV